MKILIDECLPVGLKRELPHDDVSTVYDKGWQGKKNGELLKLAVINNFDVFITVDKNLKNQINIKQFPIGIIVLDIPRIKIELIRTLNKELHEIIGKIKPFEIYQTITNVNS